MVVIMVTDTNCRISIPYALSYTSRVKERKKVDRFSRETKKENAYDRMKTNTLSMCGEGELGIVSFNSLGQAEIVNDKLDDSDEEADAAEARRAQEENKESPRRRPNISFTNRLGVMDDMLGEIDEHIYKMSYEVEELTEVVLGMSKQYDQFYGELNE
ncbi:hypothetical protein Tco_0906874 [Tanacetum coccineum]|uniref:Uncharacterized protein n=1 Tax=Tanacetum coccineum TaxID=301880 RepID=A0ABQ5CIS3_9ASTR